MNSRLLSIVVIGRNEARRLPLCLQAAQQARLPDGWARELIYVDSGSTDGSPRLARQLGAEVIAMQPVRPCAAVGRNAGWWRARGELVLFLDGDTELEPEFLGTAIPAFEQTPALVALWGHRREAYSARSWYMRVLDLDWLQPCGPSQTLSGDALVRRSALEATYGYDETLIAGEDPELGRRLAAHGQVLHADIAMTRHDLGIYSFAGYWRRAFRTGHAYAEVSWRDRDHDQPLWQAVARRNLWHAGGLLTLCLLLPWQPLLAVLLLLLCGRTAWRQRWRSPQAATLLAYAVHAHFQQWPIACGQLAYHWARLHGQRVSLIEYQRESRP